MSQDPSWAVYGFEDEIRALQQEAIIDHVSLYRGIGNRCNGLIQSSGVLCESVIRGMRRVLFRWATERELYIADLDEPWMRPDTQQLRRGVTLFPKRNRMILLMPLTNVPVKVELVPRGSKKVIEFEWVPYRMVQLIDMGIRYHGHGNFRFIRVEFRVGRAIDHIKTSPPTDSATLSPRNTPEPEPEQRPPIQVDFSGPPPGHAPIIDRSAEIFPINYQPFGPKDYAGPGPSQMVPSYARPVNTRASQRRRRPRLQPMEPRLLHRVYRRAFSLGPVLLPRPAHIPHPM